MTKLGLQAKLDKCAYIKNITLVQLCELFERKNVNIYGRCTSFNGSSRNRGMTEKKSHFSNS